MFQKLLIKPLAEALAPNVAKEVIKQLVLLGKKSTEYIATKKKAFSKPKRKVAIRHKVKLSPGQIKRIQTAYKEWEPMHVYKTRSLITQQAFADVMCKELNITRTKNHIMWVAKNLKAKPRK